MAATTSEAGSVYNTTASLLPSAADLVLALPRLAQRAGSLVLSLLPEQVDSFFSLAKDSGPIIADATTSGSLGNNNSLSATLDAFNATITPAPGSPPQWLPSPSAATAGFLTTLTEGMSWQNLASFDSIFSYLASRWAVATFIIVGNCISMMGETANTFTQAIILNRAHVYASARRHLRLNWQTRLMIRIVPILLFVYQIQCVLQTMRCQTGTFLGDSGVTDKKKLLNGAFMGEGGLLLHLSSTLLFWQTEEQSCISAGMVPSGDSHDIVGSSSVLWPLFLSLCVSHFLETVSCSLQGQRPHAETGMTIFEHSLAFAEAEAVMRSSLGLGIFDLSKPVSTSTVTVTQKASSTASAAAATETSAKRARITRGMILRRSNVPPEILLIALVSSMSHLSNHILAVLGLQARWRLVNTTIWGLCFMFAFGWSFLRFSYTAAQQDDVAILRYPTVCIIGFIPHLMIIVGTIICAFIYGFALLITLMSPPSEAHTQGTLLERIKMAHGNLQANSSLSAIHLSWEDEFYTTLLKIGFTVLTAASEAVYFNEGATLNVTSRTWLEDKRLDELEKRRAMSDQLRAAVPPEIQGNSLGAGGLNLVEEEVALADGTIVHSGYAWERKTALAGTAAGAAALKDEGAGGSQRGGRLFLAWQHARQVWRLNLCITAKIFAAALGRLAPSWLQNRAAILKRRPENKKPDNQKDQPAQHMLWMLSEDGTKMRVPKDLDVDVEYETRKRLLHQGMGAYDGSSEQAVDSHLYRWWRMNGWWGEIDSSGDYKPVDDDDDDITSVISTVAGDEDTASAWETEDERQAEDGRRTPTQEDYQQTPQRRRRYRSETPDTDEVDDEEEDSLSRLSRLLDPRSIEERQEARILSRHLSSSTALTRAQYQNQVNRENVYLLAPGKNALQHKSGMSPEEEEDLLEQLIISRRRNAGPGTPANAQTWAQGASGLGEGGPQCVVCQGSSRTVLVWPCRCLALCEDCRVSLAMNNFGSCVCCRRAVVAFSRLYVP